MEANICPRCGENLKKDGSTYQCSYCGATYEESHQDKTAETLKGLLDEAKVERLSNARRLLWSVSHEKFPSKEKVVDAAKDVLSLHAEEYLASIYLHSHDRDPLTLSKILASSNVSLSEAEETFRWLLPSLSPRLIGPLHDFVDRHFKNEEKTKRINQLEEEAAKVNDGIYEVGLPRDVFLCYSSLDMPRVIEVMDVLEQNGFVCFAAFRNLRHGKGAQENYLVSLKNAMKSCSVFLFLSSENSRAMTCDAMKVELPYLISDLPDKPRVEYILEDYENTPFLAKMTLKKAFPSQEHCRDEEDLLTRIYSLVQEAGKDKEAELKKKEEELRKKLEEESARHKRELEAARREAEEAKKKAEKAQNERIIIKNYAEPSSNEVILDEETIRKQAAEKAKADLLRAKFEKEEKERLLKEEQLAKEKEEKEKARIAKEKEAAKRKAEKEKREQEKQEELEKAALIKKEVDAARTSFDVVRYEDGLLLYGSYPQSKKGDIKDLKEALKGKKPDENGYLAHDGKCYFKKSANEFYNVEPIRWKVLKVEKGVALVISEKILDHNYYGYWHEEWNKTNLKKWLNDAFIKKAFVNQPESLVIFSGKIRADLLTFEDMNSSKYGFKDNESRKASFTDYAKEVNLRPFPKPQYYWTKTVSQYDNHKVNVIYAESGTPTTISISDETVGVRPIVKIKLPKDIASVFEEKQKAIEEEKKAAAEKRRAKQAELDAAIMNGHRNRIAFSKELSGKFRSGYSNSGNARLGVSDTFYYGEYPCRHVTAPSVLKELSKYNASSSKSGEYNVVTLSDGGRYVGYKGPLSEQPIWFYIEPIQWKVISSKKGEIYAISEKVLDIFDQPLNQSFLDSKLRLWLNEVFLPRAFKDTSKLVKIKVGDGLFSPKDFISIPSSDDASSYFEMMRGATSYAENKGSMMSDKMNHPYFYIRLFGAGNNGGLVSTQTGQDKKPGWVIGVRPVIKIKL